MKLTRLDKIVINTLLLIDFIAHFASVIETRDSKTIILSFSAYLVGALTFAMIILQFVFGNKPKSSEPSESEPDQPERSEPSDPVISPNDPSLSFPDDHPFSFTNGEGTLPVTWIRIPDHPKTEYQYGHNDKPWKIAETDPNITRTRDFVDNRRKQLAREMDARIFQSLMESEPKQSKPIEDKSLPEAVTMPGDRRALL